MTGIFADKALDRIFNGAVEPQIKSDDGTVNHYRLRGFRLESDEATAHGSYVDDGSHTATDKHGVYKSACRVQGVKRRQNRSAFFPRGWTRARAIEAISEAHANRRMVAINAKHWRGSTAEGIKVDLYLDEAQRVEDASPVMDEVVALKRKREGKYQKHCATCGTVRRVNCPRGHDGWLMPPMLARLSKRAGWFKRFVKYQVNSILNG